MCVCRCVLSLRVQESMYEALYWGVPVLVLPSLGDQWANGEKVRGPRLTGPSQRGGFVHYYFLVEYFARCGSGQ